MDDPLDNYPGYALRRASGAMMMRLAARLAPLGVSFTEASILMLVAANAGVSQSDLCRALDIQRANMTPLAARLEERGLIERRPTNGRSLGLSLTASGRALAGKVRAQSEAHEEELLARVPAEHRLHLMPALRALWLGAGQP
jgi:DNA-binding MarR family transcriptional regulator